ncbi:MAG: response regulator [Candidatus Tectimicrobiota bacterium]
MESRAALPPARILVVDDNTSNIEYLVKVLVRAGYQTVQAQSAEHALQRLRSETIDLVITDAMMPDVDGFALVQAIRSHPEHAALPIIICSAAKEKAYIVAAARLQVQGYVLKPIDRQVLLERVAAVLQAGTPVPESHTAASTA